MELNKAINYVEDNFNPEGWQNLELCEKDHQILCYGPVIYIPQMDTAVVSMTCCEYDEEMDEYISDWDGVAIIEHGEFTRYEQDSFAVSLHNSCGIPLSQFSTIEAQIAKDYSSFMEWYPNRNYVVAAEY